jgi:hypothetical protein
VIVVAVPAPGCGLGPFLRLLAGLAIIGAGFEIDLKKFEAGETHLALVVG